MPNISNTIRSKKLVIVLLLVLIADVAYGLATYGTGYGCGRTNPAITTNQTRPEIDWQLFANPCFYIYFYGIVGGSAVAIFSLPAPKETSGARLKQLQGREIGRKTTPERRVPSIVS